MFLRFRQKPKYLNEFIEKEIEEKWFSVYDYISLRELLLTTRKDFLEILSKINIILLFFTIILWFIHILFAIYFLLGVYILIFLYIFFKLIKRTYYFFLISNVVYSNKWIILADKLYKFWDKNLENKLDNFEEIFLEYLWKPSRLEELIQKKRKELFWDTYSNWFFVLKRFIWNIDSRDWVWALIVWFIIFVIYIFSLYLFYFLSYFFGFIFSIIYSFFIKIILYFRDNVELKIKAKTIKIDERLKKMDIIYNLLKKKIENFKSWEISNIQDFVEEKFSDFYTQISIILKEKKELEKLINNSKYKDFIDFNIFKKYLKKNFNKPIKEMISLLSKYEKLLENQILELKKLNKNSKKQKLDINNTEILDKNLEQKEFILSKKLEILRKNKIFLEKSLV